MTLERRYHVIAMSLMVLGIAVGGVGWGLHGTPFWVDVGAGVLLVLGGIVFAGRAAAEERKRKQGQE